MLACIITLLVTAFGVLFSCVSNPPGIVETTAATFPLSYGWSKIFRSSLSAADWLSFPATYATAFGFMFCYGKQMFAMARSGLFPLFIGRTWGKRGTPYTALLFGSSISLLVTIWGWFVPKVRRTLRTHILCSFLLHRSRSIISSSLCV
jgi:amino acid transporter